MGPKKTINAINRFLLEGEERQGKQEIIKKRMSSRKEKRKERVPPRMFG